MCRDQERKVGPDGFLDSTRMSHTFYVKKEREKNKAKAHTPKPSVVKLSTQIENDKKEHEKRIKVIEVCIVINSDFLYFRISIC